MPLINLIQEQRLEARKRERQARLFFMGFAASAVLSAGTLGYILFTAEGLEGQKAALEAQAMKTQPLVKEIDAKEAAYNDLAPRLQTLQEAQDLTLRWSGILEHLSFHTPDQTWLTSMRAAAPDPTQPINISFAGMSARQELVGEYILRLQSCNDLDDVQLKFTGEKLVNMSRNIEFELLANLRDSIEQKQKDESKNEADEQ
jgi:Tfp pilus assembly protein PilN